MRFTRQRLVKKLRASIGAISINLEAVGFVLASFLTITALILAVPLLFAIFDPVLDREVRIRQVLAFGASVLSAGAMGLYWRQKLSPDLERIGPREGCLIVSGTWVVLALVGCLPYWLSGVASFTDAFFEAMSGLTTTGASVFPDVEVIPRPLMLWRCLSQWIGGMGIVVLGVAILPMLGGSGASLFRAEAPGGATFQKPVPRIQSVASFLWRIYLLFSVVELCLLLLGGMTLFEAVCHTATTLSTGGFSTRTASAAAFSPYIQWVLIFFMFLSGASFLVHRLWLVGKFKAALENTELRFYLVGTAVLIVGVAILLAFSPGKPAGFEPTIRAAAFQVISLVTTTGYATADYDQWSSGLRMVMFMLLFVGGCTGSTSGSMKVLRHVIFLKATLSELRHVMSPRAIWPVKVGARTLDSETVSNVLGFGVLYFGIFFFVSLALTLMNVDLLAALSASASCLGNVGPGLGPVGPAGNYSDIPMLGKWILSICMVVGRLEVYSVLVLVLPRTWTD